MTLDEFTQSLDLYSADLSRWPQHLVKPAVGFMKDNAAAAALFERQLAADAQLRAYIPQDRPLSALEARIMQNLSSQDAPPRAAAQEKPAAAVIAQKQVRDWRPAWLVAPSGMLVAALLVGYFMGFNPQPQKFWPLDPAYVAEDQMASADTDAYRYYGEIF